MLAVSKKLLALVLRLSEEVIDIGVNAELPDPLVCLGPLAGLFPALSLQDLLSLLEHRNYRSIGRGFLRGEGRPNAEKGIAYRSDQISLQSGLFVVVTVLDGVIKSLNVGKVISGQIQVVLFCEPFLARARECSHLGAGLALPGSKFHLLLVTFDDFGVQSGGSGKADYLSNLIRRVTHCAFQCAV